MPSPVDETPEWMQNNTPNMYTPQGTPTEQQLSQLGLPGTPRVDGAGPTMPLGALESRGDYSVPLCSFVQPNLRDFTLCL